MSIKRPSGSYHLIGPEKMHASEKNSWSINTPYSANVN